MNKSTEEAATSTPEGLDCKSLKKINCCVYKNCINSSAAEYGNRDTDNNLEVSNAAKNLSTTWVKKETQCLL